MGFSGRSNRQSWAATGGLIVVIAKGCAEAAMELRKAEFRLAGTLAPAARTIINWPISRRTAAGSRGRLTDRRGGARPSATPGSR